MEIKSEIDVQANVEHLRANETRMPYGRAIVLYLCIYRPSVLYVNKECFFRLPYKSRLFTYI